MDVRYPRPNPALTAALVSARIRSIVFEIAELAQALYRDRVAKDSAALARSARVHTEIGGRHHDRWIGVLTIGEGLEYGAAHEFGYTWKSPHGRRGRRHAGAHDLNAVLEELSTL